MDIQLANPRGFCAGVARAIDIVNRALDLHGAPMYVRHEVVHNKFVVETLKAKGAVFVKELDEVPDGKIVIFSAHGVSKAVQQEAQRRNLKVFDATCPLVTKVHLQVLRYSKDANECILIGHKGHPEVEGTMGQFDESSGGKMYLVEDVEDVNNLSVQNPEKLAFVTQTTLSMDDCNAVIDALKHKYPNIQGPKQDDICYATQNRQDAVKVLAKECDVVIVVGSVNSSNSNRLRELAQRIGAKAYLVDTPDQIEKHWLDGAKQIGVTAGASAPEVLVQRVITGLKELGAVNTKEIEGIEENVTFNIPRELRMVNKTEL